ncbi:glycoside hydrolase family 20 protein [Trametes coccinea BRFM310]|uniref:beta-N-acetylhexosaminidase n=1 Tax=Trametes coccinea (strain BRFM310) TaxID=1353009 RepID=A0A1Y2IQA1_TRAC3|nr:glycoside hydrolase family 20 protein [Trametes coccinea BRFM310]
MHYSTGSWFHLLLAISAQSSYAAASVLPPLVPAVHNHIAAGGSAFHLPKHINIVVNEHDANSTADNGLTLIPPTLLQFSQTFKADLEGLFPQTAVSLIVGDAQRVAKDAAVITLALSDDLNATLADGSVTTEGYEMDVSAAHVQITGSGSKGAFWATRTLLQGLVLTGGQFPAGKVVDQPDWRTRGFMLDAGRQWYPITFLQDLCRYASWYKVSEFHVHLSDNVAPRGNPNAYARFRLRPEDPALAGLTPHLNETYSREEFEAFQAVCAARGVTVVPELESPGHALVITQWKPELALFTDPSLINLTVPDAIPTIKSIWKEFLPWFHTRQVSIGADEYNASLADDYNNFVNEMSDYIGQQSGNLKSIRIWGTREPSNRTSVSKNITIQHWDFGDDDPFALIRSGYDVINSDDGFQYIVMKQSGSFPQQLNQTRLWDGANVDAGGIWDPHVFDRGNASNNPSITDPRLKGAIMAVWNDHGPTASTFLEAFYALKQGLPVVASAGWQAASRPNHLTHDAFLAGYPPLEAAAPGQNLDRLIPSKGAVVVDYDLTTHSASARVEDRSGNGYDARVVDDVLRTPLGSKGFNYTLLLRAKLDGSPSTLLSGPDDSFGVEAAQGGGLTLAFTSSNITYLLSNFTLPAEHSKSTAREIVLTATENGTSAFVDGVHAGDFLVSIDQTSVLAPMAFVAPVQTVGGRGIELERFILWDGVQSVATVSAAKQGQS